MSWADKNVYGGSTFYTRASLKSGFFIADTILLVLSSGIDLYLLITYNPLLGVAGIARLAGVLIGMWLLWWKAWNSHQRMRVFYSSRASKTAVTDPDLEPARVAASMTHIGMFIAYLLSSALLIQIDWVLQHSR
jgi:hypothetical protein